MEYHRRDGEMYVKTVDLKETFWSFAIRAAFHIKQVHSLLTW